VVVVGVHLPCTDFDFKGIGLGRNGAVVIIGEGTGRIVDQIEIHQVVAVIQFFQIHVPAERIALFSGRCVAEEDVQVIFSGARLDQTRHFQPARSISNKKIHPACMLGNPPVAAGRHDDDSFRARITPQRKFVAVGEVDWEISQSLVLLESRGLGIKDAQGGEALMGQTKQETAHLDVRRLDTCCPLDFAVDFELRVGVDALDSKMVPLHCHTKMMRRNVGRREPQIVVLRLSDRQRFFSLKSMRSTAAR